MSHSSRGSGSRAASSPATAGSLVDADGRRRPARPGIGLSWLIDTSTILAAAETYLLTTRLTSWDLDTYQSWLATTFTQLAASPAQLSPTTS